VQIKAYTNEIMLTMRDMLKLNPLYKDNLLMMWSNDIPLDVARLCDFMCGLASADGCDKRVVIETPCCVIEAPCSPFTSDCQRY
jgi:hypothetical protein